MSEKNVDSTDAALHLTHLTSNDTEYNPAVTAIISAPQTVQDQLLQHTSAKSETSLHQQYEQSSEIPMRQREISRSQHTSSRHSLIPKLSRKSLNEDVPWRSSSLSQINIKDRNEGKSQANKRYSSLSALSMDGRIIPVNTAPPTEMAHAPLQDVVPPYGVKTDKNFVHEPDLGSAAESAMRERENGLYYNSSTLETSSRNATMNPSAADDILMQYAPTESHLMSKSGVDVAGPEKKGPINSDRDVDVSHHDVATSIVAAVGIIDTGVFTSSLDLISTSVTDLVKAATELDADSGMSIPMSLANSQDVFGGADHEGSGYPPKAEISDSQSTIPAAESMELVSEQMHENELVGMSEPRPLRQKVPIIEMEVREPESDIRDVITNPHVDDIPDMSLQTTKVLGPVEIVDPSVNDNKKTLAPDSLPPQGTARSTNDMKKELDLVSSNHPDVDMSGLPHALHNDSGDIVTKKASPVTRHRIFSDRRSTSTNSIRASPKVARSAFYEEETDVPIDVPVTRMEDIGVAWGEDTSDDHLFDRRAPVVQEADQSDRQSEIFSRIHTRAVKISKCTQTDHGAEEPVLPSQHVSMNSLMIRHEEVDWALDHVGLAPGLEFSTLGRKQLHAALAEDAGIIKSVKSLLGKGGQSVQRSIDIYGTQRSEITAELAGAQERKRKRREVENKRAKLGRGRRLVYDMSKNAQRWLHSFSRRFSIWANDIRYIESRFGSGVVSYFTLYRWIFVMNIILGVIWYIFVISLGTADMFEDDNAGWKEFYFYSAPANASTEMMRYYPTNITEIIRDFFTGNGSYKHSFFFLNHYKATMFAGAPVQYRMDLGYLVVIFTFYILSFVLILGRLKTLFVSRPTVSGDVALDEVAPFSIAAFSSWDYSVTEEATTTNLRFAITTVFKTLLSQLELIEKKERNSRWQSAKKYSVLFLTNSAALSFLVLAGFIIYISDSISRWFGSIGLDIIPSTAFIVSLVNSAFPVLFGLLNHIEVKFYDNPSSGAMTTLARTFVLKIASIYIIIIGYYWDDTLMSSGKCWEYVIGQNFYQLVWTNLAFTVILTILYGFGTRIIFGKHKYDFGLSDNILEIIYRQGLVWVGTIYSPMLILSSIISGWLIFTVKKFTLTNCGLPPKRIYNQFAQNIFFLLFLLLTLCLMAFPVFFSLVRIPPSCGPFSASPPPIGQGKQLAAAYQIIPDNIDKLDILFIREALYFIGTIGFIGPFVLLLFLVIYYLTALGSKRKKRLIQLQHEVNTERADKKFLLRYYKVKT